MEKTDFELAEELQNNFTQEEILNIKLGEYNV